MKKKYQRRTGSDFPATQPAAFVPADEPRPGETVHSPAPPCDSPASNPQSRPLSSDTAGMHRLLSIESSPTMRRGIERLLFEQGFDVVSVPADEHALAALERELALGLSAVVLGSNSASAATCRAIATRLGEADALRVGLLVLAPPSNAGVPDFVAGRRHTRLEHPTAAQQVPGFVHSLLAQLQAPEPSPTGRREGLKVLLVDDSKTSRTKYKRLLQSSGYAVTACDGPREALTVIDGERFDLAIIDYYMPGMNGAALCRALRAETATRDLTLAILTASYSDALIHDCLEAGAAECMFKDESNALFLARVGGMARLRERELRLSEERQRLALLLESVGDGLYGVDRAGRITFANRAALRALGHPRETDVVGVPAQQLIHPADEQGRPVAAEASFLQQAYELADSLDDWETVFRRADGELFDVECNVRPQFQGDRCTGSVVAFRDITERKRFEAELQWQLQHDHLTRLYNRRHFEQQLDQELIRLRRSAELSALLFIDLDRFKHINDTAGHAAGDALLASIGRKLLARARASDVVARLSGDEFAVLLRNVDEPGLVALAESFRAVLDDGRFIYGRREFEVSGSVGAVRLDRHSGTAPHVMNCADAACRVAKQHGRNRIHCFDVNEDAGALAALQQSWSHRLQRALASDAFALQFQSIVSLSALPQEAMAADHGGPRLRRAAVAARHGQEVFLRLEDLGARLQPKAFMSHAERFNLLPALDGWVLDRIGPRLTAAGVTPSARYHVNVAVASLLDGGYVAKLKGIASHEAFAAGCLYLEVKESDLAPQLARALPVMQELAALGLMFVLDEFGRGLGALDHLRSLPIAAVKLDTTLVQGLTHDKFGATLVRTMTELAHAMNLEVFAPAVEDVATLRQLHAMGLDRAQGFVLGRPGGDAAETIPAPDDFIELERSR